MAPRVKSTGVPLRGVLRFLGLSHIDTTVIRLLDGTRAYLHAVIDNFSRRVLAWRVVETFAPVNSVAVLLDASRTIRSTTTPVVWRTRAWRM